MYPYTLKFPKPKQSINAEILFSKIWGLDCFRQRVARCYLEQMTLTRREHAASLPRGVNVI